MAEFTVWEVYVDILNLDLGWVRRNHGLYSEYDVAVDKRNVVADDLSEQGLEYEVIVKGRKVNEKGNINDQIKSNGSWFGSGCEEGRSGSRTGSYV